MSDPLTAAQIQRAYALRPYRRPLWARVMLSYSFGWFFAGEVVGILLLALVQRFT